MPPVPAVHCDRQLSTTRAARRSDFYALGVGLSTTTLQRGSRGIRHFSMPSVSGCALRRSLNSVCHMWGNQFLCPRCRAARHDSTISSLTARCWRFYVLDTGLSLRPKHALLVMWCPLWVSMPSLSGCSFQGLLPGERRQHPGVSMPSVSGCALRRLVVHVHPHNWCVSMPSVSGCALGRMPTGGARDLRLWCPFRHPRSVSSLQGPFPARPGKADL
jgi:hypothetical protein